MPRTYNTITVDTIQASARCPVCGELVYSDNLTPREPYFDPRTGGERYRKLQINCPHCGRTNTVAPRSL